MEVRGRCDICEVADHATGRGQEHVGSVKENWPRLPRMAVEIGWQVHQWGSRGKQASCRLRKSEAM